MFKKFLGVFCLFLLVTAFSQSLALAEQQFFKMAEKERPSHPAAIAGREFAQLVEAKTKAKIVIDVFSGGVLGDEETVLKALVDGRIDFATMSSETLAELSKEFGIFSLPFLFHDDEHLWKVFEGPIGKQILATLAEQNLVGLGFYQAGAVNFYAAKKSLQSPQDMKGLKVAPQTALFSNDFLKALGAIPTPTPDGDVYMALHGSDIDAAENTLANFLFRGHYDVAKEITLSQHRQVISVLVASKKSWDKISAADQKIILASLPQILSVQKAAWAEKNKKDQEEIKSKGVRFVVPSDMTAWEQAAQKVHATQADKFGTLIDDIKKAQ